MAVAPRRVRPSCRAFRLEDVRRSDDDALFPSGEIVKVLHLGKFYPPARGGMETILALICEKTADQVRNRALVANDTSRTVAERHGDVDVLRVGAWKKIGAVALCPMMPLRLARETADLIIIHEP